MKIIGVTGSSGAGKTTICAILKEKYGVAVIDADQVARRLSKSGTAYFNAIVECFGEDMLNADGELERRKLANLIYQEDTKRQQLNAITFQYVVSEIKEEIAKLNTEKIIVIDAPLLFESKLDEICDMVIGITAEEEEKIERICMRDGITEKMAKNRLNIQISEEEIRKRANYVIMNDGYLKGLEKKIGEIWRKVNSKS